MKALVTGGGGFLGGALVRALLKRGDVVRSFSRGDYPQLRKAGVETMRGDLAHSAAVEEAVKGCDIVFHAAGKPGLWGRYADYYQANVEGTRSVISACRKHGINRLVYTSSPSVVFAGQDIEGQDESLPYPKAHDAHYPRTKAEAERLVKAANDDKLATVSLRPHLIWGPGDNHLVPRIVARAKSGMLRRVGSPKKVDTVYIDNAAEAHLLAADRLSPRSAVSGKVYFITNGEPRELWGFIDSILGAAGLPPVEGRVSPQLAYAAGVVLEGWHRLFGLDSEPRMTRFLARELSTAHWFDIGAARRDLGYVPRVSIEEGLRRLKASFDGSWRN